MEPTGSEKPIVYMLGEAPGADEDDQGKQFVGDSGKVLRFRIPRAWTKYLRWNNVVRSRPPKNRDPSYVEIECCRPSIVRDIEAAKPRAIFGFGNVPLHWAIEQTGITNWNGRRVPVKIGSHTCWYFPMLHPSYVMRSRKFVPRRPTDYGSEDEFTFALDLKRAFAVVEDLPDPVVHTPEMVFEGIDIVTGSRGWDDVDRVKEFLDQIWYDGVVGYDYETTAPKEGLARPYTDDARILSVALSGEVGTLAIVLEHKQAKWSDEQLDAVYELLTEFLIKAECVKAVHNLAFEMEFSGYFLGTKTLRSKWGCTMSQGFILDERPNRGHPGCQSLEFLCIQHFGINIKKLTSVNRKDLESEPLDKMLQYNGVDAKYHRLLYAKQREDIHAEGLVEQYEHHVRRIPACVLTQLKGIPVSQKVVNQFYGKLSDKLADIEEEIAEQDVVAIFQKQKQKKFRPSANHDVGHVVQKILREKVEKLDEATLLTVKHPIIDLVLEWRDTNKQLSTYVLPLKKGAPTLFPDGKLHPIISTTSTRTWRTSSEDPNSQNFPKRTHKEVRSQVVAPEGWKIVSFDYGSIQARNVAMESKDETLVRSFWDRYDIHGDWMRRIAKKCPYWLKEGSLAFVEKDKDLFQHYRYRAKNQMVFPSFFGAQPKKVSSGLGIDLEFAEELHEEFWDMFPDVKTWHVRLKKQYQEHGYVAGCSGFRRRAPLPPNQMINAPIQADEAIIVLDAMIRLSEMEDPRYQPIMEIHDDLTFLWRDEEIEENAEVVVATMLKVPFKWAQIVPIVVEMSVGQDWASTKGIENGEFSSDTWKGRVKYVPKHE